MVNNIVLNIPHSSDKFPEGTQTWKGDIETQVRRWTDWYTDRMFSGTGENLEQIVPVIFSWSRFFCDAERLENDPLESIGQGIAYTDFAGCHRALDESGKREILRDYYLVHQRKLKDVLSPTSFLLDCHSFPPDLSTVEVCIGINDDWSTPDEHVVSMTKRIFCEIGYNARINEPYSNSMSPHMPFPYPSMMIELNKSIYMDANGGLDPDKALNVNQAINAVYRMILDGNRENGYLRQSGW